MKRIILLLDGTWNDDAFGFCDTNIVRLRENISSTLSRRNKKRDFHQTRTVEAVEAQDQPAAAYALIDRVEASDKTNLIFYERGVGTGGFFDNIRGGAFGSGLSRNIRRAYKFLALNYDPDDEIFIFGFSRGSYTARSLIGFLTASGLIKRDCFTPAAESEAWYHYRTPPQDRTPLSSKYRGCVSFNIRVKFLGVFDTVGALGVPIGWFTRENRDLFGFHDISLPNLCETCVQALAIDEHREAFEAALWRQPKFTQTTTVSEQVWFSGAHADVGGGYIDERLMAGERLDSISLNWMIQRVLECCSTFPVTAYKILRRNSYAAQHRSRSSFYLLRPLAFRTIAGQHQNARPRAHEIDVSFDRHHPPINEKIHESALLRLGEIVKTSSVEGYYAPRNLLKVIDAAERKTIRHPPVVGFDGKTLAEADALALYASAKERVSLRNAWPY